MRTCLVAIGRRENLYAREFVEHYKNLGFDNIIIMDNNYDGEEHFEEVLQDYVDQGFVIIENYRNQVKPQMRGYSQIYAKYKNDYDWIAYYDFDEFLFLNGLTLKEWLGSFPNDCEEILVNWLTMTDNNLVHYDPRPLVKRFTEPMEITRPIQYQFPDNCHVKCIIKGGLDVVFAGNPHVPDTPLNAYNASGHRCNSAPWQPIDYSKAHLKHYTTKTIEEWMTRKMVVGTPDREPSSFLPFYVGRFWKINEKTEEKLKYLADNGYSVV